MARPDRRVRWIQHCIDGLFKGHPVGTRHRSGALHYPTLRPDGLRGKRTVTAIKKARFYVGLGSEDWERNPVEVSDDFLRLIKDPFSRSKNETRAEWRKRRKLASKRRKARVKRWKSNRRTAPASSTKGLVYFDGKLTAAWIAKWLVRARLAGIHFTQTSGFRWPWYSRLLCVRICGRPRCPGLCAGETSNHSGIFYPRGASDNAPPWGLRAWLARHGAPLTNHLPHDPVHVSASGF